jgi:hypothetical protein
MLIDRAVADERARSMKHAPANSGPSKIRSEKWLVAPQRLGAFGPAAGMVIDAQDFQRIVANSVGNDERRFRNNELPRSGNTARMA